MNWSRLFLLFFVLNPLYSIADTYPEVVFDNSLSKGSYARSKVSYSGDSWVENVKMQLLVSDTLFYTPGNALSLKYNSSATGNWEANIQYSRQKYNYQYNNADYLNLRIYVKTKNTSLADLPRITITQKHHANDTLQMDRYIKDYAVGKWLQVRIPCKDFKKINAQEIITGISLVQPNTYSRAEQHIFVDQIEFLPAKYSEVRLNSAALLTDAIGYDKMVYLKWQLPLTPSIRYIKIYRSENGKDFTAIGIRPIFMQSCLDLVPQIGKKYYYKVAWVDYNYQESPFSAVKEAETKSLREHEVLDLIQLAHVNYFVENFDINSGMYMPFRIKDKAVVSTKETAGAILSLIVGTEKKFVSRQALVNRLSKITYFLKRAQQRDGIFPAFFDGRRGVPEYMGHSTYYDVPGTASLIEALLIARAYLDDSSELEKDIKGRISSLYAQVNWPALLDDSYGSFLKTKVNLMDDNEALGKDKPYVPVLSGPFSSINTYLLALASSQYPLPKEPYFNAVYKRINTPFLEQLEEGIDVEKMNGEIKESFEILGKLHPLKLDSIQVQPSLNAITRYGIKLPFGEANSRELMSLYKTFLTINPRLIQDSLTQWDAVLEAYTKFYSRRDNEVGVGAADKEIWGLQNQRDGALGKHLNPALAATAIIADKAAGTASILTYYQQYGNGLFSEYGFRSWLDLYTDDISEEYLAANQSSIAVAIENAQTGLIWKLYEQIPELQQLRRELFSKVSNAN
ncbi:glucoamylase family protein [Sphingobacterium sp. Mn56C]|uniref:glucoamylase family protein n=1 Tax=Sphingobacterium sp. Mn56C TaxID=3395261 RepID=UPI003BED37BD